MTDNPHQLVLDLPNRSALGREDFLVSGSNNDAVSLIDTWPHWPHQAMVLIGPEGSGKTHLANVWRLSSKAKLIPAHMIDDQWVRSYDGLLPVVLEDFDRGKIEEQALFHLLNLAKERGFHILLTTRTEPGAISIELPDLNSRLRALPVVYIQPPDETLLQILLIKLFDDRQLPVSPAAVKYLARHMERSMSAATTIVDAVDRAAWETKGQRVKRISRERVADVLEALANDHGASGDEA